MRKLRLPDFVCIIFMFSFFISSTMLAGETTKDDKKSEIKYESTGIDFKDAILKAADAGKINIILGNGIDGNIAVNIIKIKADRALRLFTTIAGCKIIEDGDLKIIVKKETTTPSGQTDISVADDIKYKVGSQRKAELRPLLAKLFTKSKTDVILGESVKGTCLIRTDELPVSKVINGLMRANRLQWTTIDGIPFITKGTSARVVVEKP